MARPGRSRSRSATTAPRRFQGQPGGPGALLAQTAFLVARNEGARTGPVDAIALVWDMDDQGDDRRRGLAQGRAAVFLPMVLGRPDPEREAWVIAGFEPENAAERDRLEAEQRSLKFDPRVEARRLRDKNDRAPRNAKRVLAALTGGDPEREARCWIEAPLATLRARGGESGLAAFLDEVATCLGALLDPRTARR